MPPGARVPPSLGSHHREDTTHDQLPGRQRRRHPDHAEPPTAPSSASRAEVQALLGQLTSLEGSWSGQASVAFQAVVADWRATQQRVEESLVGITTALGSAGQQYAEIEQANVRLFGR